MTVEITDWFGFVETSNLTPISRKCQKNSRMGWSQEGVQALLSFRPLRKSNHFDQAWNWIMKEIGNQ